MTVLINRNVLQLTLQSAVDVNLQTFINMQNTPYTRINITINSQTVIGTTSSSTPAITTGDLTGLDISLVNYGEIQGRFGASNSGDGGDAITATSDIIITNHGAIRGGGAGGGKGGSGATGSNNGSWTELYSLEYINPPLMHYWVPRNDAGATNCGIDAAGQPENELGCRLHNNNIGTPCGYPYIRGGSTIYTQGAYKAHTYPYPADIGDVGKCDLYALKWATKYTGTRGSGGNGGAGQGYGNLTEDSGSSGGYGTYSAGRGGTGANGATWGLSASTGSTGNNGTAYYDGSSAGGDIGGIRNGRTTTYDGYSGSSGGDAGASLLASNGATITLDNQGTVQGPQTLIG